MRTITITSLFVTLCYSYAPLASAQATDTLTLGRQCAEDFYQGRHESLWGAMTIDVQKAFGTQAALTDFQQKAQDGFGQEKTLLAEHDEVAQGLRIYTREAEFTKGAIVVQLRCVFDDQERITGFFLQQAQGQQVAATSAYLGYQTKAPLRLPFDGDWFTFWGGRTIEVNYHAAARDQRFAYDFLVMREGTSYSGDPKKNESYFCWNQQILAPADGTVVVSKDGISDNEPGKMDTANVAGNHVILDLGNNEFALLGHLKQGSVRVDAGEQISAGQELGRCGNSGNTSEPHLHFHLQNTAMFGQGDGLPAFFNNYLANGNVVERGEPVRGQTVSALLRN